MEQLRIASINIALSNMFAMLNMSTETAAAKKRLDIQLSSVYFRVLEFFYDVDVYFHNPHRNKDEVRE